MGGEVHGYGCETAVAGEPNGGMSSSSYVCGSIEGGFGKVEGGVWPGELGCEWGKLRW